VTMMLSPDLLDRRALALLALVDMFGTPIVSPVTVTAAGVRVLAKREGRIAVLEAPGFAAHASAFAAPPATPALRSKHIALDLTPIDGTLLPRRHVLRLPRNADPALKSDPLSLFQAEKIVFSAAPPVRMSGNACIVRVSVRRDDGACIEHALVRARSADSVHTAWALTDAAGEAALVFPALPISFPGGGGTTLAAIGGSVIVTVDPTVARFTDPAELGEARRAAASRTVDHPDPDAIAAANAPVFAAGTSVQLSAGTQPAVALQWTAP